MIDPFVFWMVAVLSVATAMMVVTARNLVHGALAMVATFSLTAVLYLALSAAFIAAVQIIVYAGAIMVLFVFVVMLMGRRDVGLSEPIGGQRTLTLLALVGLAGLLAWAGADGVPAAAGRVPADQPQPLLLPLPQSQPQTQPQIQTLPPPLPDLPGGFGSPASIGDRLFTEWVLPVEVVSILLLAAMLGVIVIARSGGLRGREIEGGAEADG